MAQITKQQVQALRAQRLNTEITNQTQQLVAALDAMERLVGHTRDLIASQNYELVDGLGNYGQMAGTIEARATALSQTARIIKALHDLDYLEANAE